MQSFYKNIRFYHELYNFKTFLAQRSMAIYGGLGRASRADMGWLWLRLAVAVAGCGCGWQPEMH